MMRPSRHDESRLYLTSVTTARAPRHHRPRETPSSKATADSLPSDRRLPRAGFVRKHSRRLRVPAVVVQFLLAGWLVFGVVAIVFGTMQRSLLHRVASNPARVTLAELVTDQHRVDAINGVFLGLLVATGHRVPRVVPVGVPEPRCARPPAPIRHGVGDRWMVRAVPQFRPPEAGGRRHLGVGERVEVRRDRRAWRVAPARVVVGSLDRRITLGTLRTRRLEEPNR